MTIIPIVVSRKGGAGSGNWGHTGRPGLVGGSGGRGGTPSPSVVRGKVSIVTRSGQLSDAEDATGRVAKAINVIEEWSNKLPPKVLDAIDGIYVCESSVAFRKEAARAGLHGEDFTAFWDAKFRTMVLKPHTGAIYRNTFFHEAGHAAYQASSAKTSWNHPWNASSTFDRHTAYARTDREEGFAESFMAYVRTDNVAFDSRYRATFDAVQGVIDGIR